MFAPTAPYTVHLLKVYIVIMFPLVSYANETCGLFFHHFIQKLGQFLQFACTFCHRKNLCLLPLLPACIIYFT